MTYRTALTILGVLLLARPAWAGTYSFTTVDDPLATNGQTAIYGISNNGIVTGFFIGANAQ